MKTHWKKLTNPNYMGTYAIEPGEDLIGTIKEVRMEEVKNERGSEMCSVMHFEQEEIKPLIMNKTNFKAVEKAVGTPYTEDWKGKNIAMYIEHGVQAFGTKVDAVRIRPFAPKQNELICEECGAVIKASAGMTPKQIAEGTKNKYGKMMCAECGKKAKEHYEE